jgi:hypothetical protein
MASYLQPIKRQRITVVGRVLVKYPSSGQLALNNVIIEIKGGDKNSLNLHCDQYITNRTSELKMKCPSSVEVRRYEDRIHYSGFACF